MQNQYQYCPNCRQVISITDSVCKHCGHIIVRQNYENKYQSSSTGDEKTAHLGVAVAPTTDMPVKERGSKKNIIAIIGIILAVVAFVVLVVLAITKDGKKKETSEDTTEKTEVTTEEKPEDTTEATTTEATTEQPDITTTENNTPGALSDTPEGMGDDWKDMQIYIDGDLYQLPVAYTDFMATGWTVVSGDDMVPGLNDINVVVERDGMKCLIKVMNYDVLEASREVGYVHAIYMDADSVPVGQHEIIIPGGVTMYQSSAEDIASVYGEPDVTTFGDEVTQLDYATSTISLLAEFLVDKETGLLGSIYLYYNKTPEGITYDISQVSTSAPAFNNNYVAPSGPSQDRFDSIVTVDGANYQLPVPVSVFLENGWTINPAVDDLIPGKDSCDYTLYKGDSEIDVCLYNYTMDAMYPINAMVVGIRTSDYFCNVEVIYPGGIVFETDTGNDFSDTYGDMGEEYYEESDGYAWYYEVYSEERFIYIYASSIQKESIVDYYYYEFLPDSIE